MKKFLSTALALTLALSLAGCAETNGPAAADNAETNSLAPTESAAPAGPAAADSDMAYVKEKGNLVIGITDFAPMDYQDESGAWIGFDADMAKLFAERLGVEPQFQIITDWDAKAMELEGMTVDVVWNGMTLTDDVKAALECSNAYCENAQVVVVPQGQADQYQTVDSVKELNFAVENGSGV